MQPTAIQAWIDELCIVPQKRRGAEKVCARSVKSRRGLVETSANVAKIPAPRQQRRNTKKPVVARRRGRSAQAMRLNVEEEEDDEDELLVQTPTQRSIGKPSRQLSDLSAAPAPVFQASQSNRSYGSYVSALGSLERTQSDQPVSPSRAQSATESSTARSRSSSPVKRLRNLQHVGNGIYHTSLDSRISRLKTQLGAAGYELWQAVSEHGKLLPYNIQDELAFFEFDADDISHAGLDTADLRDLADLKKEYEDIVRIREWSVRCEQEQDHETGWNHAVHSKVLELALGFFDNDEVGFRSAHTVLSTLSFEDMTDIAAALPSKSIRHIVPPTPLA